MRIGYFLSCEEYGPRELVEQAVLAEQAGFESLWISDHFHPWNDEQGQSPFVWSVIGAIAASCSLPVTTAVTCPTTRVHPAIVAQAAATASVQLGGRFTLGVGTGEALNEHVLGDAWPAAPTRRAMLEEAVAVMRALWTGETVSLPGIHYAVENARLYTCPDEPPPVFVSGFGPKSTALAGRIGDGYITTRPDADLIGTFRESGGQGKPMQAGYKVCWGHDDDECVRTAHRVWGNEGLPGELAQVLPSPKHFEQATQLVSEQSTRDAIAYGNDPQRHIEAFRPYADAGFDAVHISQIGARETNSSAKGFFDFYRDLLPELRALAPPG